MKRTMVCLAMALMVCSSAFGAAYTWMNAGDRDLMNVNNWTPVPGAIAAGDDLWVHENGVIGSMSNSSPYLATATPTNLHWLVIGFGDSLGGGRVDVNAGGILNVDHVIMGWAGTNPNHSTSILSLNGTNSTLSNLLLQAGRYACDVHVINDGGTWSGGKLWVGGHPTEPFTGTAQVDLLAGDVFLGSEDDDVLLIATNQCNVDIQAGRLFLWGHDRTNLVTALLDGRLTGYGSSANIRMDTELNGDWVIVTAVEASYEAWTADWGLEGSDTNRSADLEYGGVGDGVDNLLEYVLGGNPTNDDAAIVLPVYSFPDADTWEYVYRRRSDAADRGLTYELLIEPDLTAAIWTNPVPTKYETGTNTTDSVIHVVTNTIPTDVLDKTFLKLKVTEN